MLVSVNVGLHKHICIFFPICAFFRLKSTFYFGFVLKAPKDLRIFCVFRFITTILFVFRSCSLLLYLVFFFLDVVKDLGDYPNPIDLARTLYMWLKNPLNKYSLGPKILVTFHIFRVKLFEL